MSLRELQPREKKVLLAGGAAVVMIIAYFFLSGGEGGRSRLDVRQSRQSQKLFLSALQEYQGLRGQVEAIDRKLAATPPDYDLYGELIKIQEAAGLADNTRKMNKEQGSGTDYYTALYVDWDLQGLYLDEVVEVLSKIEELPAFVRVSQLSLKKRFQDNLLDVSLRVTAYAKNKEKSPTPFPSLGPMPPTSPPGESGP